MLFSDWFLRSAQDDDSFHSLVILYISPTIVITEVLDSTRDSLSTAAELLKQWEVVAFPTETIYGLFANATDEDAVRKVFLAKNRPADNPLIVHVADRSEITRYAVIENDLQQLLIDKLMPGPFTLVLPKKDLVPDITTGWMSTICIRMPDHVIARQIIRESWYALAWPSANLSGRPSPSSAQMVLRDMDWRIPLIVDGWRTLYGIESTVVKVDKIVHTNPSSPSFLVKILRPWFITKEDIEDIVGDKAIVEYHDQGVNESPGTRYRHYSPHARITILTDYPQQSPDLFLSDKDLTKKTACIATKEFLEHYSSQCDKLHQDYGLLTMPLGSCYNLLECAQSLYQLYATCDALWIEQIFIEGLPEHGVWYALMNRIRKSLSH